MGWVHDWACPVVTGWRTPVVIGVSLKMYFDPERTIEYCTAVAALARRHEAIISGRVSLFVMPTFLSLASAIDIFDGAAVEVGAQDLFWEDRGAFTGEISGADLRALGCRYVELGHAERRELFGEGDSVVQRKLAAALRNGLRPVLCVGELHEGTPAAAAARCIDQLNAVLAGIDTVARQSTLIIAYEPVWAIGAVQSASVEHVTAVTALLREWLGGQPGLEESRVIYGGSAGPGLLSTLNGAVDGLFLGRFAHDPGSLERILDEAMMAPELL